MNTHSEFLEADCIALVSYVPDPLGPALDQLRQHLTPNGNTRAHITLLPPRPLLVPVDLASQVILETLQCAAPFEVEISGVRCFPGTNVLYLGIGEGTSCLHDLHDSLNSGALAHTELFDYLPHLTLSAPLSPHHVDGARQLIEDAWQGVIPPPRFRLDEAALLWRNPGTEPGHWERLWTQRLGTAAAVALAAPFS
ncbi:MAG TPA: 2'-5' RNA ligase family protein [Bryobacteraceae bacterium]|nr:2'-5' RNA ligase family protein [Bryobacteraceae bacterium]